MNHGLVVLENKESLGIGLWNSTMESGEYIAVYAPRVMDSFDSKTGDLWRSAFVRDSGKIYIGPLAKKDTDSESSSDYGRYEPEFYDQFKDMLRTCTGAMVATTCDIIDNEAITGISEFQHHSDLQIDFSKSNWKTCWKHDLSQITTGNRWLYFPHPIRDFQISILLSQDINFIEAVINNRTNDKEFEVLERW